MIEAKPSHKAQVVTALFDMRQKPGCQQYDLYSDCDDPGRLTMIERWRDDTALDLHMASPYFTNLQSALSRLH